MSLTAEQLAERRTGIGGSDCAAVLGLSTYKTALELYLEKRGELANSYEETEDMWWGRMMEPIVRQKYAEKTGRVVLMPPGTLRHPEHPFMLAHIDGYTTDRRGYEGKTAFRSLGWGEEGSDEVPQSYLLQCHHYLTVCQFPVWDVAVLIGRKYATYEIPADHEMSEMLIEAETDFMRRVREGDPPALDYTHKTSVDVMRKVYKGTDGRRVMASVEAVKVRATLQSAQAAEKAAKAAINAAKAQLLEEMQSAALLAFDDGKAFRRQLTQRAGYTVSSTEFLDTRFINDPGA